MIKGFMRLKDVQPGELVRLKSGTVALISQYLTSEDAVRFDGFIADTGEALHADVNEWVMVLDLDSMLACAELDDFTYPDKEDEDE